MSYPTSNKYFDITRSSVNLTIVLTIRDKETKRILAILEKDHNRKVNTEYMKGFVSGMCKAVHNPNTPIETVDTDYNRGRVDGFLHYKFLSQENVS